MFDIVSLFGIIYGCRLVNDSRMFIEKGMINDYWIVSVFGIVSVMK